MAGSGKSQKVIERQADCAIAAEDEAAQLGRALDSWVQGSRTKRAPPSAVPSGSTNDK